MTLAVLTLPVVLPAAWQYFTSGIMEASDLGRSALVALGFAGGSCDEQQSHQADDRQNDDNLTFHPLFPSVLVIR